MGAPLATRLLADGLAVADVPAKLAARVRTLSTGHGRKTDEADALSVAVAALDGAGLRVGAVRPVAMALRALTEHRDDLVKSRTQTVNRLHVLLAHLIPGGAAIGLTADAAALLLRRVRPRDVSRAPPGGGSRSIWSPRSVGWTSGSPRPENRSPPRCSESGTTLTELFGIGGLLAGKILRPGRRRSTGSASAAAFASYTGTAPIAVSSGDVVRHRLSRAEIGN